MVANQGRGGFGHSSRWVLYRSNIDGKWVIVPPNRQEFDSADVGVFITGAEALAAFAKGVS